MKKGRDLIFFFLEGGGGGEGHSIHSYAFIEAFRFCNLKKKIKKKLSEGIKDIGERVQKTFTLWCKL